MNLIGGLDRPSAGKVRFGDRDLTALGPAELTAYRRRSVGFVFQFYNLMPVLTAEGNVELPLLLTKLSAAQRRKNVAVALEIVGLADRAKQTGRTMDQTKEDFLREKQPMLAFSTPESIGALTVFLCGDAAATITGSAYSIDGGWVAQ